MRLTFASVLIVGAIFTSPAAWAAERTVTLSVPGMNCASCPYIVKTAISRVQGVTAVAASLDDRTATVTFDDAVTSIDAVTAATANVGYESSLIEAAEAS